MKKILIIEDDHNIRESVSELLETRNYSTIKAKNGQEGVLLASRNKPDLILCDVMMPEMNGLEVLTNIRNNIELAITPFIFLTAKTQKEDVRAGMVLGADDYLTKPFLAKELFEAVEARLHRHGTISFDERKVLEPLRKKIINQGLLAPTQALIGSSELLLKYFDDYSKDELVEFVTQVKNSGSKIERAAKNIILCQSLQLAKHDESIKASLVNNETKNTDEIIRKSTIEISKIYNREQSIFFKNVDTINLKIPSEIFRVIIRELVHNAFQYSKNGLVTIEADIDKTQLIIKISNSCKGFSGNMIENLGQSPWKNSKGLGLGLYLVKSLVELSGGNFHLKNYNEGVQVVLGINIKE